MSLSVGMRLKALQEITYAGRIWPPGSLFYAWRWDALDMINRDVADHFNLEDPADLTVQDMIDFMLPPFPPVALNPTSAAVDAGGIMSAFDVTMTGPGQAKTWSVTKDDVPWLAIVSPTTPQPVDGSVIYSVAANVDPERSANLYVNNATFTITQADGTTPLAKQ